MKSWYLLYCKPREELRAQQNLALQGIETYLPLVKSYKMSRSSKIELQTPLFPSYLFIYFDPNVVSVRSIHSTRGAIRLVGCNELMTPIGNNIVEGIKQRLDASPYLEVDSKAIDFKVGEQVEFIDGPFQDLQAVFLEHNSEKRCLVLFRILGQSKSISVEKSCIRKAS